MCQQVLVVGDALEQFLMLILDLLALQGGQPAQLHIQDGLSLDLGELEALHQAFLGHIGIR